MEMVAGREQSLTEAVQRLEQYGFQTIPLYPGRKQIDLAAMGIEPLHLQNRSKLLKESLFRGVVVTMAIGRLKDQNPQAWFANPGANVGIVTGADRLAVLDFDGMEGFRSFRTRNRSFVESAPVSATANGVHVYFRATEHLVSSSMYMGFRKCGHIKSIAGYVVAPPSKLAAGSEYSWIEGSSVFDKKLPDADLAEIGLRQVSPVKGIYDHILKRGSFEDK